MSTAIDWDAARVRVREAIKDSGKSLRAIAADADISHSIITEFAAEGSSRTLSIDVAMRLAPTLKTTFGGLLGLTDDGQPNAAPITEIPLSWIKPDPNNPRHPDSWNHEQLYDLAASIAENGVLSPLFVYAVDANHYDLIAGHRRLAALNLLVAGEYGFAADYPVPVRVFAAPDETDSSSTLYLQLIENLSRENMHPLDEGEGLMRLNDAGETTERIAQRIGLSQRHVQNRIHMARRLSPTSKRRFRSGEFGVGHAEALARHPHIIQDAALGTLPITAMTEAQLKVALALIADANKELPDTDTDDSRPAEESTEPTSQDADDTPRIAAPAETPRDPAAPRPIDTVISGDDDDSRRDDEQEQDAAALVIFDATWADHSGMMPSIIRVRHSAGNRLATYRIERSAR